MGVTHAKDIRLTQGPKGPQEGQAPEGCAPFPKPDGYCANCAIPVDDGHRFCSPFCRGEWIGQHPAK